MKKKETLVQIPLTTFRLLFKLRFMSCVFLIHGQAVFATTAHQTQFNKKSEEAIYNLQTHKKFMLNFQQEFFSILRNKTTRSEGTLQVSVPSSFRFEIQKPRNELYVSNGIDFWKYLPDLSHAQHLKANALEMNYISLLTNPANIKKFYIVSEWTAQDAKQTPGPSEVQSNFPPAENAQAVSIKLEPKGDKQQKVLYASVNVKKGLLEELRVVQLNGNRVRLLFSNYKDKNFTQSTFSFTPPRGIAVDYN